MPSLVVHHQASDHERVFYDLPITDPGDGTLLIPAGRCWVRHVGYDLPAYRPQIGAGWFMLRLKLIPTGAGYLLDRLRWTLSPRFDMDRSVNSFGVGVGLPAVAWRDREGEAVHLLHSVDV